jgi:hypothetical protein
MPDLETTTVIEAIHDLRVICDVDLQSAISQMSDLLATGQLPPVRATIDGIATEIEPSWWAAGAIKYPHNAVVFRLVIDGESKLVRATNLRVDRAAWGTRRKYLVPEPSMEEWARDRIKVPDNMACPEQITPERTEAELNVTDRLAEWIFEQHPDQGPPKQKKGLLDLTLALASSLGKFKMEDFTTAYQRVYQTDRGRPPLTGWPLREPYKKRFSERPQNQ